MKKIIFLIQGIVLLAIGMSYGQAKISPDSTRAADAKPAPGIEWSRSTRDGKAIYYLFDPKTLKSYPMYTGQFANSVFLGKQEAASIYQPLGAYQPLGSYAPTTGSSIYVPFTGATSNLNLGNYGLFSKRVSTGAATGDISTAVLYLYKGNLPILRLSADSNVNGILRVANGGSAGLRLKSNGAFTTDRNIVFRDQDITVAGLSDFASYIPYNGANANVDLGNNQIAASAFVKSGGISNQYLMADGSTTTVIPSSGNGSGGITSLTTSGSGSASISGNTLNIPTPTLATLGGQQIENQRLSTTNSPTFAAVRSGAQTVYDAQGNATYTYPSTIVAYDANHLATRSVWGLLNSGSDMYFGNYLSGAGRTVLYGSGIDFYSSGSNSALMGSVDATGLTSNSFKKTGGTSGQYLMADGSISVGPVLSLTTNGIAGAATLSGNTLNIPTPSLSALGAEPIQNGVGLVRKNGTVISFDNTIYQPKITGTGIPYFNQDGTITNIPTAYGVVGSTLATRDQYGNSAFNALTAAQFKVLGGTSAQYLMADGSVSTGNSIAGQPLEDQRLSTIDTPSFSGIKISGKLTVQGPAVIGGQQANLDPAAGISLESLKNSGSLMIGWNRTASEAETDFIASRISSGQNPYSLGGFAFYDLDENGNQSQLMRIRGNGNVGIGVMYPANKLDVAGTIHAKEVLVNLDGFPDYVFDDGYKLPALNDVKSYIDKNHHLKDMPSEQDVVKNGLKIGEVANILTKKIEELTLYMIEKDRQLTIQKKLIADISQQLRRKLNKGKSK